MRAGMISLIREYVQLSAQWNSILEFPQVGHLLQLLVDVLHNGKLIATCAII